MKIERDADDVARCFALERTFYEGGCEQTFTGEVVGLIAAGAFVAFGAPGARGARGSRGAGIADLRGMLPVRRMRGEGGEREWWELNEQGTILHGESPGSTLRLGDAIEVRVARVDVAAACRCASASDTVRRFGATARRRVDLSQIARPSTLGEWPRARASARSGRATWRRTATPSLSLRADRAAGVRDRARGHRGQGAARLRRPAEGRLRRDPRRRAVAALASTSRRTGLPHAKTTTPSVHASCCCTGASSTDIAAQRRRARADARADAHLLRRLARQGRDRARARQGPLRQAPDAARAGDQARHGTRLCAKPRRQPRRADPEAVAAAGEDVRFAACRTRAATIRPM